MMCLTHFIEIICGRCKVKYMVLGDENTPEGMLQEYREAGGKCPTCGLPA